jgi:L,D-transpeptidase catalytic domain
MLVEVTLPSDRTLTGTLQAFDDEGARVLGPVNCLGKADNATAKLHDNPTRDSLIPFGDTPVGTYGIVRLISHTGGESETHTYGTYPSVLLDPKSGLALKAKKNGRSGIMIHGGAASTGGKLRPTFGCIRLFENDERDLAALVLRSALASSTVSVKEV